MLITPAYSPDPPPKETENDLSARVDLGEGLRPPVILGKERGQTKQTLPPRSLVVVSLINKNVLMPKNVTYMYQSQCAPQLL